MIYSVCFSESVSVLDGIADVGIKVLNYLAAALIMSLIISQFVRL